MPSAKWLPFDLGPNMPLRLRLLGRIILPRPLATCQVRRRPVLPMSSPFSVAATFNHRAWFGLIPGLRPANERRRYFVMTSPIDWAQA